MRGAPDDDLRALDDATLLAELWALERRRSGAPLGAGVRPRRRPWTYRDIWRREALAAEVERRGLRG